jgi:hypothetical protein
MVVAGVRGRGSASTRSCPGPTTPTWTRWGGGGGGEELCLSAEVGGEGAGCGTSSVV